jgi:hypothetical protein
VDNLGEKKKMIQITATGKVYKSTENNKFGQLKIEAPKTYFKDGQQVTTIATYYLAIWFAEPTTLTEGETLTVIGHDAYRLSPPKTDGKIYIDRVINDAQIYRAPAPAAPSLDDVPF